MSTAQAPDREFKVYRRGERREEILTSYRVHLRQLINPDTNAAFTEPEIATATATHSQPWIRADAIDLTILALQNNDLLMADQIRLDRAGTSWLEGYHGPMWGETKLPAEGGSGPATQSATVGTIFVGSTTIPDAVAYACTAPDGKKYQLLFTVITPGTGIAALTFKGVDTGTQTNLPTGTELVSAANRPAGAIGNATVTANFTGGVPAETDADFADRIADRIKHKPACGNSAHIRAWARQASASVEDGFIYCCALHAGTVIVCATQKRGTAVGPIARIPNAATLAALVAYLTPPASPVLPARPYLLVVAPQAPGAGFGDTDLVLCLAMPTGQVGGWTDYTPWPETTAGGTPATITTLTDQQHFRVTISGGTPAPPAGVTAPALMVWNDATSRFETLNVQSVVLFGGLIYDVVLTAAPTKFLALGDYISPDAGRRVTIATAIEAYFDALGPGEAMASTDNRYHRAVRFPLVSEEWPQNVGESVVTYLLDALGAALSDASIASSLNTVPIAPTAPEAGPHQCFLGRIGIYKL